MKKYNSILILCPYPEGKAPSQRLKYEQYIQYFKDDGWSVDIKPFISIKFWDILYSKNNFFLKFFYTSVGYINRLVTLFTLHRYNVIYIHLWATPFGLPIYEYLVFKLSKNLIYDIDDLIFINENNNFSNNNKIINFLKGRGKPLFLIKNSSSVICCTPYLDEFVKKYNNNSYDISSTINTDILFPKINKYYSNNNSIILGWSGSFSTISYLYLISNVLIALNKKYNIKLFILGAEDFKIEGIDIKSQRWSENLEVDFFQSIDIGLYPLPIDEQWVLGKSGLKAIQYMSAGLPTVATAVGANFRVIDHNHTGFLAKNDIDWFNYLSQLIESPELRKNFGVAARNKAVNDFSIISNKHKYLNILSNYK